MQNLLQEKERLEWQTGELEKLQLRDGEWESIQQEHSRLAHAASLMEGVQQALAAISESDHPVLSQLNSLQQRLYKLVSFDAALRPAAEALENACIQLQESSYALNDYLQRTDLDPERLREVELRVDAIHSTARRFHVSPEQLPDELARLQGELEQMSLASDPENLRNQEQAAQAYLEQARSLSQQREQVARSLSEAVTVAMQDLSLRGGQFAVALHACDPASYGLEQVEFLVAGHAGVQPRPLAKVASGGELARISLAISVIASSATTTPTLIFDEVDSGIGGAVAEVVGRLLKRLGQERQVLCVTHLPQVASQANQHFQVSKDQTGGRTSSQIARLDSKQRVEEIARMLGGLEITATTRKHARELLAL
jgi:DNA repair protein RecN (Recombination protein N)